MKKKKEIAIARLNRYIDPIDLENPAFKKLNKFKQRVLRKQKERKKKKYSSSMRNEQMEKKKSNRENQTTIVWPQMK